jgi:surface polysaccharide O-acyltransferase-like enzyme
MGTFVGLIVALVAFAAVVISMVYFADFEKSTGYPRRHAFYLLLAALLVAVILLIILYELGVISSGLS